MSLRWFILKIVYPFLMLAGSLSKRKKELFQKFIININNKLVRKQRYNVKNILILLSHCLQRDKCKIRLTHNVYNCEKCGKCEIRDLIQIADENHLSLFVATGGSLARRIVNEAKPEAIIAIACENELSSGIADTYPLPVIGIANERPYGPCINTTVDLEKIKDAVNFFSNNSSH
ncbi:MAG: DUF116 domain-containing protein [Nitrospirae bacterium]|nr:DUF116 domain-containing protein [Nitrospirota bacterium]